MEAHERIERDDRAVSFQRKMDGGRIPKGASKISQERAEEGDKLSALGLNDHKRLWK